mgnify:CR=1 FL=1
MSKMEYLGHPDRHFWLTRSMARVMGLNLSEAIRVGALSRDHYAEMVVLCRKCPNVERCHDWLAHSAGGASRAAEFCAHADTFNILKQNKEMKGWQR